MKSIIKESTWVQKSAQGALPKHTFPQQQCVMWRYQNEVVRTPPCSLFRFGALKQHSAFGEPVGRDSRRVFTAQPVTSHIFGKISGEHLLLLSSERLWLLKDTRSVSHTFSSLLGNGLIIIFLPQFSHLFSITAH